MRPFPIDPRYLPQLEIVPVEPTIEKNPEEDFWEKNSEVPIEKIVTDATKPKKSLPN